MLMRCIICILISAAWSCLAPCFSCFNIYLENEVGPVTLLAPALVEAEAESDILDKNKIEAKFQSLEEKNTDVLFPMK